MKHFFRDVPGLGNVVVSRTAQVKISSSGITEEAFAQTLLQPERTVLGGGIDVEFRERAGVRAVILLNPTPFSRAKLVTTVYRIQNGARLFEGARRKKRKRG